MNGRIGIFYSVLQDRFPRGIHRVARAVTEHLSANGPDDIEFVCLTDRVKRQPELTFGACELASWLKEHPLRITSRKVILTHQALRMCYLICPPILKPWAKEIVPKIWPVYRYLKRRIVAGISRGVRLLRRLAGAGQFAPQVAVHLPAPAPVSLNELDLVISFDPFDDIWEMPVENYRPKMVGWFYDAIPRRINEGLYWKPDDFDTAVGNMALRADLICCDSPSAEQDLVNFFPAAQGKTAVVPLGHDVGRFLANGNGGRPRGLLKKHGISESLPYLMFVGTVEPRKNIVNILRSCRQLRKLAPELEFQLVIVGAIGGQPGLKLLLAETRRSLPVIVTNYVSDADVADLLRGSHGFLFPSLWEGFGIPPLEAMTAGTIVITSDVSSLPEVCGEHALYCDPYDPIDMAAAIALCLRMPADERRARLREARRHAAQFTWERSGESVLELLMRRLNSPSDQDAVPIRVSENPPLRQCG